MKVTVFNNPNPSRPLHEFEPGDVVVMTGSNCPRLVTGNGSVSGSVYLPRHQHDRDCEFMSIDEESECTEFTKVGNIAVDVTRKGGD